MKREAYWPYRIAPEKLKEKERKAIEKIRKFVNGLEKGLESLLGSIVITEIYKKSQLPIAAVKWYLAELETGFCISILEELIKDEAKIFYGWRYEKGREVIFEVKKIFPEKILTLKRRFNRIIDTLYDEENEYIEGFALTLNTLNGKYRDVDYMIVIPDMILVDDNYNCIVLLQSRNEIVFKTEKGWLIEKKGISPKKTNSTLWKQLDEEAIIKEIWPEYFIVTPFNRKAAKMLINEVYKVLKKFDE